MSRTVLLADQSIASLSGSSQQLVAKDMSRSFLHIMNIGNANIAINPTGAASLTVAGSDIIPPLGSATYAIDSVPGNAFQVIGTAGQPVTCWTSP